MNGDNLRYPPSRPDVPVPTVLSSVCTAGTSVSEVILVPSTLTGHKRRVLTGEGGVEDPKRDSLCHCLTSQSSRRPYPSPSIPFRVSDTLRWISSLSYTCAPPLVRREFLTVPSPSTTCLSPEHPSVTYLSKVETFSFSKDYRSRLVLNLDGFDGVPSLGQ